MTELPPKDNGQEKEPTLPDWRQQFIAEGYVETEDQTAQLVEEIWDRLEEFLHFVGESMERNDVFFETPGYILALSDEISQRTELITFFEDWAKRQGRTFDEEVERWYIAFLAQWQ